MWLVTLFIRQEGETFLVPKSFEVGGLTELDHYIGLESNWDENSIHRIHIERLPD